MATTLARVLPFMYVSYMSGLDEKDRVKLVPYEERTGVLEQRTCTYLEARGSTDTRELYIGTVVRTTLYCLETRVIF